jgi:ubiquitin-protein ligase
MHDPLGLMLNVLANTCLISSSPLNGEAALLWDRDQVEYKKKVLARHQEPADLEGK